MNSQKLRNDLRNLSYVYTVAFDEDKQAVVVRNFNLPPGYNCHIIPILLQIPDDYPESPPGVGSARVYVPADLRFEGRKPEDFHEHSGPTRDWAWWCYERIDWNPCKDDLITFFELLRAHLTNPR